MHSSKWSLSSSWRLSPESRVSSIFGADGWMWQCRIILLSFGIHLLPSAHNGLSNLLPLAALSVSLSAHNGNAISAVRVLLWILLTVFSSSRRKMFISWNRSLCYSLWGSVDLPSKHTAFPASWQLYILDGIGSSGDSLRFRKLPFLQDRSTIKHCWNCCVHIESKENFILVFSARAWLWGHLSLFIPNNHNAWHKCNLVSKSVCVRVYFSLKNIKDT